jgi:superoxide dismutase, Fe-Mn family
MIMANFYTLPRLAFGFKDLEPFISESQLTIHYQKHHQAYVNGANAILEMLDKARKDGTDFDVKAALKSLSFNIGGHDLHSMFWGNLSPKSKTSQTPTGKINELIVGEFGSFDRFRREFTQAASSVEGSGWASLAICTETKRPLLMQIEKHNTNTYPGHAILLVLDVFEHAYYLDYKNDRANYIEAFWNIVNWEQVNRRLEEIIK